MSMSSERLYYTDAYLIEFDAVVRDVERPDASPHLVALADPAESSQLAAIRRFALELDRRCGDEVLGDENAVATSVATPRDADVGAQERAPRPGPS